MNPYPYHFWVKIWITDTLFIQISFCFQYGLKEHLLRVSFNSETGEDRISDGRGQVLINVKYKNGVLPVESNSHVYHNCTQTFDRWDHFLTGDHAEAAWHRMAVQLPPPHPFHCQNDVGQFLPLNFRCMFYATKVLWLNFFHLSLGLNFSYGYFVAKTALPSAFSAKNHYHKFVNVIK